MEVSSYIIDNEILHEFADSFIRYAKEDLPPGSHTCLGSFAHAQTPANKEGTFITFHIRPHKFLETILFVNNLDTLINQHDIIAEPHVVFAFLECIRRHLNKPIVYWKNINPKIGAFEIYV